jgi:S23 ribosomal protein.
VRAADSIAANIAEGYGRYFFGEYRVFLYYARGSLYECKLWLEKTRKRSLINDNLYQEMRNTLDGLAVETNKVIKIVKGEQAKWKGRNW